MNKTAKIGGEACVQLTDGTYSADALHEQMTEGVDDRDFCAKTRAWLLEKGSAPSALNSVFPDLEPLPVDLNEPREREHRTKIRAGLSEEFGVSAGELNQMFPDLPSLPEN